MVLFSKKEWLNEDDDDYPTMASMSGYVIEGCHKFIEAGLVIRDCNDTVKLDFNGTPDDIPERIRKATRMINFIMGFRDALIKERERIEKEGE